MSEPLIAQLAWLGLVAEPDDGGVRVRAGRGPTARELVVATEAVPTADADVAAFARGVHAVLLEPARSPSASWDFARAAAGLLPRVERRAWMDGVRAAAGAPAFALPFGGDLVVGFVIELDVGWRALTEADVARWGVTADRVERAAASLLFHRSAGHGLEPTPREGVQTLRIGDGFDAARALVLDAIDFDRTRARCYFAVPSCDRLIVSDGADASALEAVATEARAHFEGAHQPLSAAVFAWEATRRIPEPVR
jgi:hypothetical protein